MSSATDVDKEKQLLRRKQNLDVQLKRVDDSLEQAGYEIPSVPPTVQPSSGICINGQLSFRGEQKARELFQVLDEDGDGLLTFQDIRALHYVTNPFPPTEHSLVYWEAWQARMEDCGASLRNAALDEDNFVRYKRWCEKSHNHLLEAELQALHMPILPKQQHEWKILNAAWDEHCTLEKSDKTKFMAEDRQAPLEEIPFILAAVSTYFHKSELYKLALLIYNKRNLMEEVSLYGYRRFALATPERFQQQMLQEFSALEHGKPYEKHRIALGMQKYLQVPRSVLVGWYFSDRPRTELQGGAYRMAAAGRLFVIMQLRRLRKYVGISEAIQENLRRRSTFKGLEPPPPSPPAPPQDTATVTGTVVIGDGEEGGDGMRLRIKFTHVKNPRQALNMMKLPTDAGTILFVDLLLRASASESAANRAVRAIRTLLHKQLHPELMQLFRTYKCILAVLFRKDASIDAFFARNRLTWSLTEIIADITMEISCSLHLSDLLENAYLVLQNSLAIKATVNVSLFKPFTLKVLERIRRAMTWAPAKKIIESEVRGEVKAKPASASLFENRRRNVSSSMDDLELEKITGQYASSIKDFCAKVIHRLRSLKDGAFEFAASVTQAAEELYRLFPIAKRILGAEGLRQEGFVHKKCSPLLKKFKKELQTMATAVQSYRIEEAEMKRAKHQELMMKAQAFHEAESKDEEKQRVLEQLRRMNIRVEDHANLWSDTTQESPDEAIKKALEEQIGNNELCLEALDACYQACIGIDGCCLFFGRAMISCTAEGLDVFDVMPRPPDMNQQQAQQEQKKDVQDDEEDV